MRRAIFTEQLTAQVQGSAQIMVTVVATQELGPGDVLRRFKEEATQDEPRRGNNIGVVGVGLVAVGVRKSSMDIWDCFHLCVVLFLCVCVFSWVRVTMIVCPFACWWLAL